MRDLIASLRTLGGKRRTAKTNAYHAHLSEVLETPTEVPRKTLDRLSMA